MKKKCLVLLALMCILLMPAYAVPAKIVSVFPNIKFNGTEATCTVQIVADKNSDTISATMELWQGNAMVDKWSNTGFSSLLLKEVTTVAKGKTYKLVVNYTINGVKRDPISISKTNN